MNQNDTIWCNCTNEELLETLKEYPKLLDELRKIGYNDLINSYDALLPKYNMDRLTTPVQKHNSDEIAGFGYWVRIDDITFGTDEDTVFKTKAEAQLASIKETAAELHKRILSASPQTA